MTKAGVDSGTSPLRMKSCPQGPGRQLQQQICWFGLAGRNWTFSGPKTPEDALAGSRGPPPPPRTSQPVQLQEVGTPQRDGGDRCVSSTA